MERKASWGRVVGIAVLGFAVVVAGSVITGSAEAQQGGPGRGRGPRIDMTRMMYLEWTWAALNFGLDVGAEKLATLKPIYQTVYDKRQKARAEAMQNRDFQAMMGIVDASNQELGTALLKELTPEQIAGLEAWQKTLATLNEMLAGAAQGDRPRMGSTMHLERSWGMVSFGLKATDEQIATLAPIYKGHAQLRTDAAKGGDANVCATLLENARADIDGNVKQVLTEEQWKQYEEQVINRGRGGPGGPGGGGRGGQRPPGGPGG